MLPVYFEKALKVKYVSDDESVKMLDIINSGKQCDITYGFYFKLADSYPMFKVGRSDDIVSIFAKNLNKWQGVIDKFQNEAAKNANT